MNIYESIPSKKDSFQPDITKLIIRLTNNNNTFLPVNPINYKIFAKFNNNKRKIKNVKNSLRDKKKKFEQKFNWNFNEFKSIIKNELNKKLIFNYIPPSKKEKIIESKD